MATTGVGFRWLDLLEKEFDKACVGLDTSLADLETEEPEVVFSARQKIATLSSCFAQLTHKALTIFQHSAKLEAELVDMRAELVQTRAASAGGCQEGGDVAGNVPEAARARAEAAQLARENAALRETVLALHSELFGARLATKYLDKELAGRIQQLQLLGSDMRAELRDSLWAQVEAEILLQRHKTLVRVCRGTSPRPPRPSAPLRARPRTVRVRRSPHLGLGISVTGGREHGVPILISELEMGGPAALTGQLYVGDAILAINDVDLTQACHKEAVQALQSVKGDCALCVQYIATDDEDRLSEDNYRFPLYPEDGEEYCDERDGSGVTPTAPRTPEFNHRCNSVERSRSGSESRFVVFGPPTGPAGPEHAAYPDYNNINNNLDILDMDDDSIKIEARLEMVKLEEVAARQSPAPSASPGSTPVHLARTSLKKRKALDWRTKGAYSAVSVEGVSSDEPGGEADAARARDWRSRGSYAALKQRHRSDDDALDNRPRSGETCDDTAPVAREATMAPSAATDSAPAASTLSPVVSKTASTSLAVDRQAAGAPAMTGLDDKGKLNGDQKPRKEIKNFRIGSARRVEAHGLLVNGDGDPDFGTPV
ncbi:Golgi-associated PDZ and coiled-coil motif-containing protein isoform X2 [Pieris rapae]|nr:Golgi-associated PDZ and coiled-coil motif-containing protein isoform X2 [Pieris rapae]XP_045486383.1 Golgi-associated PDZ and coiled-coil motif-containing protein isoform X2 [Pieris rapae]